MESKSLSVFKFGGASVKDADGIKNVASIINQYKDRNIVVVVSAIGKTTNALEAVIDAHTQGKGNAYELLEGVKRDHYTICQALFDTAHEIFPTLNDTFVEIEWVLEEPPEEDYDYIYDQVVSVGELASSKIVEAYLRQSGVATQWLDARDCIRTDNRYREAWVDWDVTVAQIKKQVKPLLLSSKIAVTQGFIASTSENYTTTLGREGSDYTAAIISYCLDAKDMIIWKDVPGVLTADPRKFENVTKLDSLSYREAIEMTYYGAKVIHPKTIKPLQNKSIPLLVKSFIDPSGSGTIISNEETDIYPPMIAIESDQALLNISTRDYSFVAEHHLSQLFNLIAKHRLEVHIMQNTAISFAVSVSDINDRIDKFTAAIEKDFKVTIERGLELITIRHYQDEIIQQFKTNRVILLENRIRDTIQMVTK